LWFANIPIAMQITAQNDGWSERPNRRSAGEEERTTYQSTELGKTTS
jgi:hypothetical protein